MRTRLLSHGAFLALSMTVPRPTEACSVSGSFSPFECAVVAAPNLEIEADVDHELLGENSDFLLLQHKIEELFAAQGVESRQSAPPLDIRIFRESNEVRIEMSSEDWRRVWKVTSSQDLETESPNFEDLESTLASALDEIFSMDEAEGQCAPNRYYSASHSHYFEQPPSHDEAAERYFASRGVGFSKQTWNRGALLAFDEVNGEATEIATFDLDLESPPREIFVAEGGDFVVVFEWRAKGWSSQDYFRIYRGDGTLVTRVRIEDLLSPSDVVSIRHFAGSWATPYKASLFEGAGSPRLILDLAPSVTANHFETRPRLVEIDLGTGALLSEMRDLLPQYRALPAIAASSPPSPFGSFVCEPGVQSSDLPNSRGRIEIAPAGFSARSIRRPLPIYPEICQKVRLEMKVEAEVLVDEQGEVVCARSTKGPFGLSQAVTDAALGWKFAPLVRNGERVSMSGRIAFDFRLVDPLAEP